MVLFGQDTRGFLRGCSPTPMKCLSVNSSVWRTIECTHRMGSCWKGPISVRMLALGSHSRTNHFAKAASGPRCSVQNKTRPSSKGEHSVPTGIEQADLLPGLVVEQPSGLVVGFNSAGMLRLRDDVIRALRERIEPTWLVSMVTKDAARRGLQFKL